MAYRFRNKKDKSFALRLVKAIAGRYTSPWHTATEIESFGKEGLKIAMERYDRSRRFKFVAYACWYIRKNIENNIKYK